MALELAHRLKSKNIQSYSVHPGAIMGTNLGTHLTEDLIASLHAQDKKQGFEDWKLRIKSPQAGCATHLVAAFDRTISGKFCSNCGEIKKTRLDKRLMGHAEYNGYYMEDCNIVRPLKQYAADKNKAERLWKMSEEMVGEKFEY
jgi:hypothetical protein